MVMGIGSHPSFDGFHLALQLKGFVKLLLESAYVFPRPFDGRFVVKIFVILVNLVIQPGIADAARDIFGDDGQMIERLR